MVTEPTKPLANEREPWLAVRCDICNAKPDERCASLVDASKYREEPHYARRELAERNATR